MRMDLNNRKPQDMDEFSAMTSQLARELHAALDGRNLHAGVLLAALIDVHQTVALTLSEEGQQSAAVALRSYSDALLAHCDLDSDIHIVSALVSSHQVH